MSALRKTRKPGLAHYRFSAFEKHNLPVEEMLLRRSYASMGMGPPEMPQLSVGEPVIYGGIIADHFGHFLLETLSRVWAIRRHPDRRAVWHTITPAIRAWQADIATLLGFSFEDGIILRRPTTFIDMLVPTPGFVIGVDATRQQMDALGAFPGRTPVRGRRIWLSRSSLPPQKGGVLGEDKLENQLRDRGWFIFQPERHEIREQLDTLSNAELIAGIEGSALHSLVLIRDLQAEVRILQRGRVLNPNYDIIAKTKGFRQRSSFAGLRYISGFGAAKKLYLVDPDAALAFLNE